MDFLRAECREQGRVGFVADRVIADLRAAGTPELLNMVMRDMRGKSGMEQERVVLCGANAYEQKYYFNQTFKGIPQSIQEELHIICVLFTEEVGGVFTIVFEPDGSVSLETDAEEDDIYYDEIGSGLLVSEIRRKRQELLESLSLYYRVFVLKEPLCEENL